MNSTVFRKPFFWLIFACLSIAGIFFTMRYFGKVFPIVNLTLNMDRSQALAKAQELAKLHKLGPEKYNTAAAFKADEHVKTFVELQAGGKEAFAAMLKEPYYSPYAWYVRHFKEYEKNEVLFYFKPDGTPYGFVETLSENTKGAALDPRQARSIAEQGAQNWLIDLADYSFVEESKEAQPSGRIDHLFVYERPNVKIGDGHYRLRLGVSGDKLTQITHFVKIPEAFTLKYTEMRSANNTIAVGANLAMIVLYIVCGCLLGLFFLLRQGYVLWNTPLIWGAIVSLAQVGASINQWPLEWLSYDTALSFNGFLLKLIINLLYQFIMMTLFYGLCFMAAESLTRKAFGNHIQLWKSWKPTVASSYQMLGRVMGGYLLVPFKLVYVVLFYLVTTKYFGWWTPSEALIDPNILASYVPWFSSIALSLGAGFMEECLFRAVPLASVTLLGKRFGNKRLWLILGFIIQAIIFGAAHANYPSQPAYARLIELLFFSVIFGIMYIRYGLLTCIITHFIYDVVWFALPLFVSTAPGAMINQIMVLLIAAIPLWVMLYARIKTQAWHELPTRYFNKEWKPALNTEKNIPTPEQERNAVVIPRSVSTLLYLIGIGGFIVWLTTTNFTNDAQRLTFSKKQAQELAYKELENRSVKIPAQWQELAYVGGNYTDSLDQELQHLFIWQKAGKEMYTKLLDAYYLKGPRWVVRYATFCPTIAVKDRANEYHLVFTKSGKAQRFHHVVPESFPGKQLDEQQAREIAHATLRKELALDPNDLQEISAVAEKHPERKDWLFTFADTTNNALPEGQARISIQIGGDAVIDINKFIHIPEDWERSRQSQNNILRILNALLSLILYGFISLCAFALLRKSVIHLAVKNGIIYGAVLCVLNMLLLVNNWATIISSFNTCEPFSNQAFMLLGFTIIGILARNSIMGFIIALANTWKKPFIVQSYSYTTVGIAIGLLAAALQSFTAKFISLYEPQWADYSAAGMYFPFIGIIIHSLTVYITTTLLVLLFFILADYISSFGSRNYITNVGIFLLAGLLAHNLESLQAIPVWITSGLITGILFFITYMYLFRYDFKSIPLTVAILVIMQNIQQILLNAFPGAILGNVSACIIIGLLAYIWSFHIKD